MIYKKVLGRKPFMLKHDLIWGEICPFCKTKIIKYELVLYIASKFENIIQFHWAHNACYTTGGYYTALYHQKEDAKKKAEDNQNKLPL